MAPVDPAAAWSTADASSSAPVSGGDPLVRNGFGSPLCRTGALRAQLDPAALANCRAAGFVASAVPTGNYAFDVHIDTGPLGAGNLIEVVVQDLLLTPAWTALVWIVHALVVALEWCYSIDLLGGTLAPVAVALQGAQHAFTDPWLAAALAVAAVLLVHQGLVRRRVSESVGQAALTLAMMAAGLWVIVQPAATVGALNRLAQRSSLDTFSAVSTGSPARPAQSLASGLGTLFGVAVGGPWCYLEFGDVGWCRDPARLDPGLAQAGRAIASGGGGVDAGAAARLRAARTNGDLFLALPANGPERNSINDSGSLLHVLCGTTDATHCRGATAQQAEFRTAGGTWARAGGLLLICVGAAGMVALVAFIALRLLGAAVASLLYLLLAPAAVLAPAFGDAGRRLFTGWAARLAGAVLAKLLYSIFLGVVLLVLRILEGLGTLGWWTQWLLVGVMWWTAFAHRRAVMQVATMGHRETGVRGMRLASGILMAREASRLAGGLRRLVRPPDSEPLPRRLPDPPAPDERAPGGPPDPAPGDPRPRPPSAPGDPPGGPPDGPPAPAPGAPPRHPPALERAGDVAAQPAPPSTPSILDEYRQPPAAVGSVATARVTVASGRELPQPGRVERLREQAELAARAGDRRRAVRLRLRADALAPPAPAEQPRGDRPAPAWLEAQARLPAAGEPAEGRPRRDYATLAALVGLSPSEYAAMDSERRRATRLALDRRLAERDLSRAVGGETRAEPAAVRRRRQLSVWSPRPREREVR